MLSTIHTSIAVWLDLSPSRHGSLASVRGKLTKRQTFGAYNSGRDEDWLRCLCQGGREAGPGWVLRGAEQAMPMEPGVTNEMMVLGSKDCWCRHRAGVGDKRPDKRHCPLLQLCLACSFTVIPNQRQGEVVSVGSHKGLACGPHISCLIVCEEDCLSGGFGEEGRHLVGGASGEKALPAVSSNSM